VDLFAVGGAARNVGAVGECELIGRRREMAYLRGLLAAAVEGEPRLVLCGGEPGIGKTRLASGLAGVASAGLGARVAWARASEDRGAPPYWLWRQALPSCEVLSAPDVDGGGLGRAGGRFALFDAVTRQLLAAAADDPVLLVLDDVHWADQPSLLLLRHLARELRQVRLLVMAAYRTTRTGTAAGWPAVLADLIREPVTERVELGGLSAADTTRCAAAVAGRPLSDTVGGRLHRLTGGNPFFVREVARSLAASDDAGMAVPGSVIEVITDRVGRLSPLTRRLLAAAAVLGEQFPVLIVASLIDQPVMACLQPLEEARDAGLLEASGSPGEWRFSHGLARDAVEASVPMTAKVELHRRAALAIERTYAGHLAPRLADLARHWAAVAVTGERASAVEWATRAGREAVRGLAYEEGARLFQMALDAGDPDLGDEQRCRLLIDVADAQWRSGDLERCRAACEKAVAIAQRIGRPDLVGEIALTIEPVGDLAWDLNVGRWCDDALSQAPGLAAASRARLLARATEAAIYAGEHDAAGQASRAALELASQSGDAGAIVAALGARQLACSAPEHRDERAAIAGRMVEMGLVLRRPGVELRGRLWTIDTLWEDGDLAGIAAALGRLEWCARHVGGPLARWHLLGTRAALAQARGEFPLALELGRAAFDTIRAVGHPAAPGAYLSLVTALGHHIGHDRTGVLKLLADSPPETTEVRDELFGHIGPALILAESGRLDEAALAYRRAGPVASWRPPPYFQVPALAVGSMVAAALGEDDDVALLRDRLVACRGRHAVTGAGSASYFGPVELHSGRAAARLGRWGDAESELMAAGQTSRAIGAPAFAAEADCELAAALAQRDAGGDAGRSRQLAARAAASASELGMHPWLRRARALSAGPAGSRAATPALTTRELQVAGLVAGGKSNREIASILFLSDRTAQNHVQHILTKLGFSNRSQITSWFVRSRANE
jgi:DNA-binding CsgD family transcriptional regulator